MFTRTLLRNSAAFSYTSNALSQLFKSGGVTCRVATAVRPISCTACRYQLAEEEDGEKKSKRRIFTNPAKEGCKGYKPREVDVHESIRYMESDAYADVYQNEPVWKPYRRNMKGSEYFYREPRRKCIRGGVIATGSPCPVCRDDYLILDHRNMKLLNQFISEATGEPLDVSMTGLCNEQYKKLKIEIMRAQEYGLLEKHFPQRKYNYDFYHKMAEKIEDEQMKVTELTEEQSTSESQEKQA